MHTHAYTPVIVGKHKSDAKRNNALYNVFKEDSFEDTRSGDLQVGDIIKIKQVRVV